MAIQNPKSKIQNGDDAGNRLETVTDWRNGQYGYDYDQANRLTGLSLPNGIESGYSYDAGGRLTLLAHQTLTESLASYSYSLDRVGNRRTLTETVEAILAAPTGAYLENGGLVVIEAEHFSNRYNGPVHQWLLKTNQSGYTGTSYLQPLPDRDTLYATEAISSSPRIDYPVSFTTPGTYTLWLRGYPTNARGDSAYVGFNPGSEPITATGFVPRSWSWAKASTPLSVTNTGIVTLSLWMREDGLRLDRLVLTTDTIYVPSGFDLAETERLTGTTGLEWLVDRTIQYEYDDLYRLTQASYTSGALYQYDYDPVGNRLQQIINGDTTSYQYDAANRLEAVSHQAVTQTYTFDNNGNLLNTGVMTNSFDAANRLIASSREGTTVEPIYNGVGDRVGQTLGITTTHFALDVQGLPEVIYTSEGELYLHLPGVIVTEKASEVRYLLSDGLGSIRQVTDDTSAVVAYNEYDPYGNPVQQGSEPYGYTGEWYESYSDLLFLRARWYAAESGTFLSKDPLPGITIQTQSLNRWAYTQNNPVNYIDPTGLISECTTGTCGPNIDSWFLGEIRNHSNWVKNEKYKFDKETDEYLRKYSPLHNLFNNRDHISLIVIAARHKEWVVDKVQHYLKGIPYKWMKFGLVAGCSSPSSCKNSVTLCGICMDRSQLGNFMFGMASKYAGLENWETYFGGHHWAEGLQPPWDQTVTGVGYNFAKIDFIPTETSSMCDRFRQSSGTWQDPWGKYVKRESPPASWDWELVQDERIKECKPCAERLPFGTPHTIPAYAGEPTGRSKYAGAPDYTYNTEQIPEGLLDPDLRIPYLPFILK